MYRILAILEGTQCGYMRGSGQGARSLEAGRLLSRSGEEMLRLWDLLPPPPVPERRDPSLGAGAVRIEGGGLTLLWLLVPGPPGVQALLATRWLSGSAGEEERALGPDTWFLFPL